MSLIKPASCRSGIREGRLEFCLITSTGKRRWSFPKGVIDPGETPPRTALKEAAEEAGLRGEICGKAAGHLPSIRNWAGP